MALIRLLCLTVALAILSTGCVGLNEPVRAPKTVPPKAEAPKAKAAEPKVAEQKLPPLKDGEAAQAVECPGGTLYRVGFEKKAEGRFTLVYYGPVNPDLTPGYPHVWIHFSPEGQVLKVQLFEAAGRALILLTIDELKQRFPDACALLGGVPA